MKSSLRARAAGRFAHRSYWGLTGMRVRSSLAFSILGAAVAALLFVPWRRRRIALSTTCATTSRRAIICDSASVSTNPLDAQGNLRDWSSGTAYNLMWESWGAGGAGTDLTGYGFSVGYTQLPFNNSFFVQNFTPTQVTGSTATATAADARVLEFLATLRIRIPTPLVMPHLSLGLGFIELASRHHSTTPRQRARRPTQSRKAVRRAEFSVGGGVDRHVYDRVGIFAEARTPTAITSFGQVRNADRDVRGQRMRRPLKNTTLGTIRGGLRVRIGQCATLNISRSLMTSHKPLGRGRHGFVVRRRRHRRRQLSVIRRAIRFPPQCCALSRPRSRPSAHATTCERFCCAATERVRSAPARRSMSCRRFAMRARARSSSWASRA